MRVILFLFFTFSFSVLFSCNSKFENSLVYSVENDTITLESNSQIIYFDIHPVRTNNILYVTGRNNYIIEGYDILNHKLIHKIIIQDTIYNGLPLGNIGGIHVHNADSIFIHYSRGFSIINSEGRAIDTQSFNHYDEKNKVWPEKLRINTGDVMPAFYDAVNNKYFMRQYSGRYFFANPKYFDVPIEAFWDFDNDSLLDVPVFYPSKIKENFYGDANGVFREHTDSLNIYSFMAERDITVYNRYTGEVNTISLQNNIPIREMETIDTVNKFDMKVRIDHLITNDWFGKVLYDKYRNLYYRFISAKKPLEEDGKFTSLSDKVIYLAIYDEHFNLLDEINLGSEKLWFYSFVLNEGLYILSKVPDFNDTNENGNDKSFVFYKYKFSRN